MLNNKKKLLEFTSLSFVKLPARARLPTSDSSVAQVSPICTALSRILAASQLHLSIYYTERGASPYFTNSAILL